MKFNTCLAAVAAVIAAMSAAKPAEAQQKRLDEIEGDSVAAALATVWGDYTLNKHKADGDSITTEYMRGLMESIDTGKHHDAYSQGLYEGMLINERLEQVEAIGGFKIDRREFARQLRLATEGRKTGFSVSSAERWLNDYMSKREAAMALLNNSAAYLEEVGRRDGVMRTSSGLLFEVVQEGEGPMPTGDDAVLVEYTGRLVNGQVFSSTEPDHPVVFEVSSTIPGFSEGLQRMKKGGTYRLYIPALLGYGEKGVAGVVPPDAVTVFDVYLIDIKPVVDPSMKSESILTE